MVMTINDHDNEEDGENTQAENPGEPGKHSRGDLPRSEFAALNWKKKLYISGWLVVIRKKFICLRKDEKNEKSVKTWSVLGRFALKSWSLLLSPGIWAQFNTITLI